MEIGDARRAAPRRSLSRSAAFEESDALRHERERASLAPLSRLSRRRKTRPSLFASNSYQVSRERSRARGDEATPRRTRPDRRTPPLSSICTSSVGSGRLRTRRRRSRARACSGRLAGRAPDRRPWSTASHSTPSSRCCRRARRRGTRPRRGRRRDRPTKSRAATLRARSRELRRRRARHPSLR